MFDALRCVALSLALYAALGSLGSRVAVCQNPLLNELISQGMVFSADTQAAVLPPPFLKQGMNAEQQRAGLALAFGERNVDRMMKKSFVSPFEFSIKELTKRTDQGTVQLINLMFVAHGKLEDIEDRHLFDELAIPAKRGFDGPKEEARALTAEELASRNLVNGENADGSKTSYGVLKMYLIDKVYVTGLTSSCGASSKESLSIAFKIAPTLSDDAVVPARWSSVTESKDGKIILGEPQKYVGVAGYATATQLQTAESAVFVEIHVAFSEPHGWFDGRNALRSKLPPLLQDAVRTFRRKLAEVKS